MTHNNFPTSLSSHLLQMNPVCSGARVWKLWFFAFSFFIISRRRSCIIIEFIVQLLWITDNDMKMTMVRLRNVFIHNIRVSMHRGVVNWNVSLNILCSGSKWSSSFTARQAWLTITMWYYYSNSGKKDSWTLCCTCGQQALVSAVFSVFVAQHLKFSHNCI